MTERRIVKEFSHVQESRYRVIGEWTFQITHQHHEARVRESHRTYTQDQDIRTCRLTVFRQHKDWPDWKWQRIHHWLTIEEIKDKTHAEARA